MYSFIFQFNISHLILPFPRRFPPFVLRPFYIITQYHAHLLGFGILSEFEIAELLSEADLDGDNEMDFTEFRSVVANARDTNSKWQNAGVLALSVKRYNNVLSASDALFHPLQRMVSASCETADDGRRIAGCSRLSATWLTNILLILVTFVFVCIVGTSYVDEAFTLLLEMDQCTSITATCVHEKQQQMIALASTKFFPAQSNQAAQLFYLPIAILYFYALCFLELVGITRSQAHLGHVIFGLQVINVKTGKPAGFGMTLLRIYLPTLIILAVLFTKGEYIGEVSMLINFINFIVNPIMLAAHPKQQTVWDLILGQNVVVKE